ncbi:MAG: YetF domain-containing protein [Actinomycetota bacterium]
MFTHAINASTVAGTSIWQSMFGFEIPATEKIIRTLGVYLGLAIIMRLAGKRQLAQLNSFDLIVMLLLSNVVQNAVIGPDNSLTGGLLGAVVLVGFNAVLERIGTATKRATMILEGTPTTLVSEGEIVEKQVRRTGLRDPEVVSALRHQGASSLRDVHRATLEPGGSISVELNREAENATYGELRQAVLDLQRHLDERLSVLERGDRGPLGGDGVPG